MSEIEIIFAVALAMAAVAGVAALRRTGRYWERAAGRPAKASPQGSVDLELAAKFFGPIWQVVGGLLGIALFIGFWYGVISLAISALAWLF